MVFLTLLAFPLLIALLCFVFGKQFISWREFLAHVGAQCVVALMSIGLIYFQNTWDIQVLNGQVTSKKRNEVHCRHSYSCNCHEVCSGSGEDRSCYEHCDTCYEHSYDVDWNVYTNIGSDYTIDTIDRRGLKEPPRWTATQVGDPIATTSSYQNYIKASPDTLFRNQGLLETYKTIPSYPSQVYDYWKVNRFITVNASVPDRSSWNVDLQLLNGILGPIKQCNIVVIITKGFQPEYAKAIEQSWLGGKKNDVVLIVNIDEAENILWVDALALVEDELFKIKLRDDILKLGKLSRPDIIQILDSDIRQFYHRKSMKEFEYLRASITPSPIQWCIAMFLGLLFSLGLGFFFYTNDVFEEGGQTNGHWFEGFDRCVGGICSHRRRVRR